MATEVTAPVYGESRVHTANGTALTNAASYIELSHLYRADLLSLIPRALASSAAVVRYLFNPYLTILRTQDGGVTFTDHSHSAQDASTGTAVVMSSQDTLANGDALYVGAPRQFRGVSVDVTFTNGTASRTLTCEYWDGSAWVSIGPSDGTSSSTAFDQDGDVTWTVPGRWALRSLASILGVSASSAINIADAGGPYDDIRQEALTNELYWTRWTYNGALDSSVTIDSMRAMNRVTTYDELTSAFAEERRVHIGPMGDGCIEALTDTGTASLIVKVTALGNGRMS